MILFLLGCLLGAYSLAGGPGLARVLAAAQSCLRASTFWMLALFLTAPLGPWAWFGLGVIWLATRLLPGIKDAIWGQPEPVERFDETDGIGISASRS